MSKTFMSIGDASGGNLCWGRESRMVRQCCKTEMHCTLHVQSSKIAVSPSDEKFDTKSDLAKEFSSSTFGGIASQSDTAH